jgi:hypothetical protein
MEEHPHHRASELFSCKGLTAVVTGALLPRLALGIPPPLRLTADALRRRHWYRPDADPRAGRERSKGVHRIAHEEKLRDVAQKYGGKGSDGRGEIIP